MNREELSELLSGYLDGELNDDEVAAVERLLLEDQDARTLLEELRQMVHMVGALPRHDAPASIAEDIAARLERSELLGDSDAMESMAGPKGRSPWSTLLSMAAGIAVVATGVLWYTYDLGGGLEGRVAVSTLRSADDESSNFKRESAKKRPEGVVLEKTLSPASTSGGRSDLLEADSSVSTKASRESRSSRLARKSRAEEFAEPTDGLSDLPAVSVSPMPRFDQKKLFASLNVEQILVVEGEVSDLREHSFRNEELQLAISTGDAEESGELARRLVDALRSRSVVNAAAAADETPLTEISKKGFFLRGASGVNYRAEGQEQILVHLRVSDRDALLDEIGQWSELADEVELQVGPVRVLGLAGVRDALAGNPVSGSDEFPVAAMKEDLDESAAPAGPNVGDSIAVPGMGFQGLLEMMEVLARAGGEHENLEDSTSAFESWSGAAAAESEHSPPQAPQPLMGTGESPGSPEVDDGDQPLEEVVARRMKPTKPEGISGTGSLVASRMKDLKTTSEIRMPARRGAGGERTGEFGPVAEANRSVDVPPTIEQGPEQFVTLVFQIIPQSPAKAKASKSPGGAASKKAKAPNGRPRVTPKGDKKDKPVRK